MTIQLIEDERALDEEARMRKRASEIVARNTALDEAIRSIQMGDLTQTDVEMLMGRIALAALPKDAKSEVVFQAAQMFHEKFRTL